jgi:hypothetical protein
MTWFSHRKFLDEQEGSLQSRYRASWHVPLGYSQKKLSIISSIPLLHSVNINLLCKGNLIVITESTRRGNSFSLALLIPS